MNSNAHPSPFASKAATMLAALLCCTLLSICLSACSSDEGDDDEPVAETPATPEPERHPTDNACYISLRVSVDDGTPTRADGPVGGEGGNKSDQGTADESTVHDAVMLLYHTVESDNLADKRDMVNNPELVTFDHAFHFTGFTYDGGSWKSQPLKTTLHVTDNNDYHTIILANLDATTRQHIMNGANSKTLTLKDIRDGIYTLKPWTATVSGGTTSYSRFVMTSSDDNGRIKMSSMSTSSTNSYIVGAFSIQRLAARIDIVPIATGDETTSWQNASAANPYKPYYCPEKTMPRPGYVYQVMDANDPTIDTRCRFILTGIKIENDPTAAYGTFYIKRTGTSATQNNYFGTETSSGGQATVYVKDPHTAAKLSGNGTDYSSWYSDTYNGYFGERASGKNYFTTAYTTENTTLNNMTDHATTLLLEGYYLKANSLGNGSYTYSDWEQKTYRYVLRHSDPNNEHITSRPMLYGVVRNNIYRLSIAKVLRDGFDPVIVVEYWNPADNVITTNISSSIEEVTESWPSGSYPNDSPRRKPYRN